MLQQALWSLHIFCWQDYIEILSIFAGFFYISLWFKKDTNKPLLAWFYGYTTFFLLTDFFHMTTLSTALITFAPLIFIVLVLIHKETLQKNFIALHAVRATTENKNNWLEELIQATLTVSNKNIGMTCVIEKNDALISFTHKTIEPLNAPVSKELVTFLGLSPLYKEDLLLIINQDGKILSINDTWKKNSIDLWLTQEVQEQEQWVQDGIFFTTKTDAFIFKHDPISRTYTTLHKGKITTHITAQNLLVHLSLHCNIDFTPQKIGGVFYGNFSTQSSSEQSLS